MSRFSIATFILACLWCWAAFGGDEIPNWHMEYTPSHRASFEEEWKYRFPACQSHEWVVATRYPPELAWSKDVTCKAEILTSSGWKELKQVDEGSLEHRKMLIIDLPHDDPKLMKGFTLRTTLTATICDQKLKKGKPVETVPPLSSKEEEAYLAATPTYDFEKPMVKRWMNEHKMWIDRRIQI